MYLFVFDTRGIVMFSRLKKRKEIIELIFEGHMRDECGRLCFYSKFVSALSYNATDLLSFLF